MKGMARACTPPRTHKCGASRVGISLVSPWRPLGLIVPHGCQWSTAGKVFERRPPAGEVTSTSLHGGVRDCVAFGRGPRANGYREKRIIFLIEIACVALLSLSSGVVCGRAIESGLPMAGSFSAGKDCFLLSKRPCHLRRLRDINAGRVLARVPRGNVAAQGRVGIGQSFLIVQEARS